MYIIFSPNLPSFILNSSFIMHHSSMDNPNSTLRIISPHHSQFWMDYSLPFGVHFPPGTHSISHFIPPEGIHPFLSAASFRWPFFLRANIPAYLGCCAFHCSRHFFGYNLGQIIKAKRSWQKLFGPFHSSISIVFIHFLHAIPFQNRLYFTRFLIIFLPFLQFQIIAKHQQKIFIPIIPIPIYPV